MKTLKNNPAVTTRGMRKGEVNGVDYEFVSKEDFQAYQARGDLLESGIYDGCLFLLMLVYYVSS